ncbi:PepSY domain-containing protein [Thalassomonas haliotis]|uniref:PepSY domain-containing protein n=1 Tax=Thalassomonas haliotis TaxID=485448 RepID=A0ABY7VAC4_9GAMM|nr:PepSY domain-containing protein [Thalassomonas haliotis]WDE10565.1 PepSY domain-containing protein [Thalassomonas haliotis]
MRSVLLLVLFLLASVFFGQHKAQANHAINSYQVTGYGLPSAGDKAGKKERHKKSSRKISQQQAAQKVKNRYGGKVLKVQSSKVNGQSGYKVKLLKKDGHIISVLVDGHSGKIKGN